MAEHMPSIPEKFRLWFPYDKFWKPISPRGPFYPIRLTCKFMLTGLVILSVNHGDCPKVTPVDFSYVVSKHILSQQTSVCYLRLYDVNQNWAGWWCYFEMNKIQNSVDGAVFVITQRCTPLPYDTAGGDPLCSVDTRTSVDIWLSSQLHSVYSQMLGPSYFELVANYN